MAAIHLLRTRPGLTSFTLSLGLGTTFFAQQNLWRQGPLLCDSAPGATPATTLSESLQAYQHDAKVPVFQNGRPNPRAYSQISAGSMLGVLGGVAVSSFSKTLATTIGLAIFLIQVWPPARQLSDQETRADDIAVYGVQRLQCYSNIKNTALCQGYRSALCD